MYFPKTRLIDSLNVRLTDEGGATPVAPFAGENIDTTGAVESTVNAQVVVLEIPAKSLPAAEGYKAVGHT